jgi:hypothetical protein
VRLRFQAWQLVALLAAICALAFAGVYVWRTRGGSKPSDLVSYLPSGTATVVYIDADAMRRSGILNVIAGSKAAEEPEYKQFVDQTLFDYRQDLDAIAAAFQGRQVFLVVRGRFHWRNLMDFARQQGGSCHNGFCVTSGSRPDRRISFYALRDDILAMAVSPDDFAAYQIKRQPGGAVVITVPAEPVWARIPVAALKNANELPDGVKPYAAALGNAEQVTLTLGAAGDHLQMALNVTCGDAQTASALLVDLERATNTLRKYMASEHQKPDPADISQVLVVGTFRRNDRRVVGEWPLERSFFDALMGAGN